MKIDISKENNDAFDWLMGSMVVVVPIWGAILCGFSSMPYSKKCIVLAISFFGAMIIRLMYLECKRMERKYK